MPDLTGLVVLLRLASGDRTQLVLENVALRHQLAGCEVHGATEDASPTRPGIRTWRTTELT